MNDSIIRILNWNCNSIRNKIFELYSFMLKSNIKVACLTETKLRTDIKIPKHKDYRMVRLDNDGGDSPHGGVAIIIHKSLGFEVLPHPGLETIECFGVMLTGLGRGNLKIFTAYHTGTTSQQNLQAFRRDIRKLTGMNGALILGDFNCRHPFWRCMGQNAPGRILYNEWCMGEFEIHYPQSPTHYPGGNRTPSTLDLMLSTADTGLEPLQVGDDLGSDHRPVIATMVCDHMTDTNFDTYLDFNKADWLRYRGHLDLQIDLNAFKLSKTSSINQIDQCIALLTTIINEATRLSVPRRKKRRQPSLATRSIIELVHRRRIVRRRLQRSGDQALRDEFNSLNERIEYLFQAENNKQFQKHIKSFKPGDNNNKKLWGISRILKGRYRPLPILDVNNQRLMSDREKAEAFADVFEKNHETTAYDSVPTDLEVRVLNCLSQLDEDQAAFDPNSFVKPKDLNAIIRQLSSVKAPGNDSIRNIMIKNCSRKCIVALVYIFNACLAKSYFPDKWKEATMIPILKPGKPSNSSKSYRPISLLPCISKLFERIVLNLMVQHIEANNTIPDHQFGFRSGHSTTHQVKRITNIIRTGFSQGNGTGIVLLDLQCAFDSVWHNGLTLKLFDMGFPTPIIKLIRSFLKDRSFTVKVGQHTSTQKSMIAGVPQGAVLSPILFNIFMADLPPFRNCNTAQFADDVALISSNRRAASVRKGLNDAVKEFSKYARLWRLKLNPTKTEATFFTRRRTARAFPRRPINVQGHEINWSNKCKYLGVILDQKLLFRDHIDYAVEKSGKCIKMLYSLLNRNSRLHQRNKTLTYKVIIRPIFLYALPVWCDCALTHRKRLQIFQNKILKMCLGLPWRYPTEDLHKDAEMELVQQFIDKVNLQFKSRCGSSSNPLISTLY